MPKYPGKIMAFHQISHSRRRGRRYRKCTLKTQLLYQARQQSNRAGRRRTILAHFNKFGQNGIRGP